MRLEERYYQLLSCTQNSKGKEFFFDIMYDGEESILVDFEKYREVINFLKYGLPDDYTYYIQVDFQDDIDVKAYFDKVDKIIQRLCTQHMRGIKNTPLLANEVAMLKGTYSIKALNHFMLHSLRCLKSLCDFQCDDHVNLSIPNEYLGSTTNTLELMKDLNNFVNLFNKGFHFLGPDIQIKPFNKGSSWLELRTDSRLKYPAIIVSLMLSLGQCAKDISEARKNWIDGTNAEVQMQITLLKEIMHHDVSSEEAIKTLEAKERIKRDYKINDICQDILKKTGIDDEFDNEKLSAIKGCVDKLAKMQEKGLVIVPAFLENGNADPKTKVASLEVSSQPKKIEDQRE